MSSQIATDCWFLTGPTAAGKSAVGVELARRIDAEIVSLDSMALYRRMDIGTAKPTAAERRSVSHHLIDVIEPHEEYSLARYVEAARQCAAEIAGRGCQVLFVGGTPLYLKGLLRGIFHGPPADWKLRRRLADEAERHGGQWLHKRLAEVDPVAAARLHPNDARRLIRALEVYEKTGQPISALQRQFDVGRPAADCRVFVLDWPKAELDARIDRRVEQMFAAGLVEEVRQLLAEPQPLQTNGHPERSEGSGVHSEEILRCAQDDRRDNSEVILRPQPPGQTARQAVGYREVIEHLEGRRNLPETIELVQQHTRQLAKRQNTWFRSLSECRFVPMREQIVPAEVAEQIASGRLDAN